VRVKESVARREARLAAMTDEQLANVALTMVFIAYGGRAVRALVNALFPYAVKRSAR